MSTDNLTKILKPSAWMLHRPEPLKDLFCTRCGINAHPSDKSPEEFTALSYHIIISKYNGRQTVDSKAMTHHENAHTRRPMHMLSQNTDGLLYYGRIQDIRSTGMDRYAGKATLHPTAKATEHMSWNIYTDNGITACSDATTHKQAIMGKSSTNEVCTAIEKGKTA